LSISIPSVSPLANARACLGLRLDAMATGHLIDDRPPVGAAVTLIDQWMQPLNR
jgi:hypothetical protein